MGKKYGQAYEAPAFSKYSLNATIRDVARRLLHEVKPHSHDVVQILGYNVISRLPVDHITQAGYITQLELIMQKQKLKDKPALRMACLLPCLRLMDLIAISSGLTAENCVLMYDPRCNWRKDSDFDFCKAIKKFQKQYEEHIGFIHNRLHAHNKPMLKQKLQLAKQGISVVGLYAGKEDPDYKSKEDADAEKFNVKIVRQRLSITKMMCMEADEFLDVPLEVTYYMSNEKHDMYFRKAEGVIALTKLEARWAKAKAMVQ